MIETIYLTEKRFERLKRGIDTIVVLQGGSQTRKAKQVQQAIADNGAAVEVTFQRAGTTECWRTFVKDVAFVRDTIIYKIETK